MKERKTECYAPKQYKRLNKSINYKGFEVFKTESNFLLGSSNYDGYIKKIRWTAIENNLRIDFFTTKKEVIAEIDSFKN